MNVRQRLLSALPRLKVFPLPSAVLLPGTALPLHIFEPRYKDLTRDALAHDRILALGDLLPGWEANYEGRPALAPIACAGLVVWHEELPDGRFNLVIQGLCRVRLGEELPAEHSYREVVAAALEDPLYEGPLEEMLRQTVLELSTQLDGAAAQGLVHLTAQTQGGALADVVTAALIPDLDRRKAHLRELDVAVRLQSVIGDVAEVVAKLDAARPHGPLN